MAKLEVMQRLADKEAAKLGIDTKLTVRWSGGECRIRGRYVEAHAHCRKYEDRPLTVVTYGWICVKRGITDWRDTIRHEVAHFVTKGQHGSASFLKVRAAQGDRIAKQRLVVMGKRRCPGHEWQILSRKETKVTARGLLRLYKAYCTRCGKEVG